MRRDVLEEFVDAQGLVTPTRHVLIGERLREPLPSIQRAYRLRNRVRGQCRSCHRPAEPERASCAEHLAKNLARARASQERSA